MTFGDFVCVYVIPICLLLCGYLYLIFKALDKIYERGFKYKKNNEGSDRDDEEKQKV